MSTRFSAARLTLARKRRGLSKVALAERVDLTSRRLASYENEGDTPPDDTIVKLAAALDFPIAFFMRPSREIPEAGGVSFRSFARLSASRRDAALAAAAIAFEFVDLANEALELPPVQLPDVLDLDPRTAATAVRATWALGNFPLPNVVQLLEAHGCRIFSLVDDVADLDAYSLWNRASPYIFLTQHKSPERSRWDVSHEFAHLVLHIGQVPQGRETEQEADEFAAELLLPQDGVLRRADRHTTLLDVLNEKLYWRVSAMAYIRRLHQLEVVTERRYKSLVIEASQRGLRSSEGDIERETSGLWPKVFEIFREDGLGIKDLADRMAVHPRELRELTFGGLSAVGGSTDPTEPARSPDLRIIR
jgi:Zn-dependent peptidase ImmA (M78 family)/transcriptional regulator with XRE-family HTH domain